MKSTYVREGAVVMIRAQRREGVLHPLVEGEPPWVYSQFLNRWEPAERGTDSSFPEAVAALNADADARRLALRLARRRRRQERAWARARR